jgi:hypothetical protein
MNSERLIGRIAAREEVTSEEREQMFALMDRYYAGMRRDAFDADLDEKQWVIQILDPVAGTVRGFSTQKLLRASRDGGWILALFSGDTIVDRECWSGNPLAQLWGRFALSLIDAHAGQEFYWFLITKGFRTYRFLPLFFHEFYPRARVSTPLWAKQTIDLVASDLFPAAYDAKLGVVRGGETSCRLRPGVGEVNEGRITNADVRFFIQSNPGHACGDELCCLAPLTRENFTRAAYRTMGLQLRSRSAQAATSAGRK